MSLTNLLHDMRGMDDDDRADLISDLREQLDCALCDLSMWQRRLDGETIPVWLDMAQARAEVHKLEAEVDRLECRLADIAAMEASNG